MQIQRTYLLYHFFPAHNPYNINLYLSMNNIQVLDLEGNALTEPQEWRMVESCAKPSREVRKRKDRSEDWKLRRWFSFLFLYFFCDCWFWGWECPDNPRYLDISLEKKHDGTFFLPEATPRCGTFFCCRNDEKRRKIRSKKLWNLRITSYKVFSKKIIRN